MNKNSNSYIILYASVMVVIVAAVLSFVSLSLGGIQAENVRIEKMGDILRSVGQGGDRLTLPNNIGNISLTAMRSMRRATGSKVQTLSTC